MNVLSLQTIAGTVHDMSIFLEQYDANWPEEFKSIKSALAQHLKGVEYVSIEHVGSTSVPGLVAKPVLDVDIIVTRDQIQRVFEALMEKGKYDYLGEYRAMDHHVFIDPSQSIRSNIYVCVEGVAETRNHLGLRNMLRSSTTLRDEFARKKIEVVAYTTSIVDYNVGKGAVIQKFLRASSLFTEDELLSIQNAHAQDIRYDAIKTPRLLLREFEMKDVASYYELESSEENARYQSWPPRTYEQARECVLDNIRNQHDVQQTVCELAVEHEGCFIGRVGASTSQAKSDCLSGEKTIHLFTHVDLWFSFLPAVHGQGFATEAMSAFINALKERQPHEQGKMEMEIECDPRNEASWKLAQRLGFERCSLTKEAFECKGAWVDSLVLKKIIDPVPLPKEG